MLHRVRTWLAMFIVRVWLLTASPWDKEAARAGLWFNYPALCVAGLLLPKVKA